MPVTAATVPLLSNDCRICHQPLGTGPNVLPMGDGFAIHGVCPTRRDRF